MGDKAIDSYHDEVKRLNRSLPPPLPKFDALEAERAQTRRLRRYLAIWIILFLVLIFFGQGCASPNMVKKSEVRPLLDQVLDRHDFYVQQDIGLDPRRQESHLRSSELLRTLFAPEEEEEEQSN